ncbi:ABC-2 family transporter protein [Hathewaya proteolytica DSM 3090]|uniref:ABC-2 family transporter protein n=1 Tax=Hathewaya proteolytica DSM 3090 TaxID=1121331 RepID=A0A1M6S6Y6_9CLOT|nr:ABC-2 transporter permease [Hathewaya proteolytica]SHK40440.1 ABC-2 family transporter protein [Hathewaya proteolytica DSM 3090]
MIHQAFYNYKATLYMYKKSLLLFLIIPFFFTITKTYDDFFSITMLMGAIMVLALPECDFRDGCNTFILSTPCTRSKYIAGKFINMVCWFITVMVIAILITSLMKNMIPYGFNMPSFSNVKLILAFTMIFMSIYYLITYSLNVKFAKILYFFTFFLAMLFYSQIPVLSSTNTVRDLFPTLFNFLSSTSILNNLLFLIIMIVIVWLLTLLTIVIYEKKDF